MSNSDSPDRQLLRQNFRSKRRMLSPLQQAEAATNILTTCKAATRLPKANSVACYIANDAEIDPQKIIEYCWDQRKCVLLPVLDPTNKGHLLFVEYRPNSPTRKNIYGIDEPIMTNSNVHSLENIDLILTPLVAFDAKGNRLGMGGGYYDRTLAPIHRDTLSTQLIGLAHTCQQTDNLLTDSWDIPLHGIATPKQFFNIS